MAGLSKQRQRFAEEYPIDLNATQAAIRAGYSEKTADRQGSRLLSIVEVQEAIEKQLDARSRRTEITQDRVLEEFARIGFHNAGDFFTWGPDGVVVIDSATLTPEQMAVVQEVSETVTKDGGTIKIKLADKLSALEKIGRHLGMFKDAEGNQNIEVIIKTYGGSPESGSSE